MSDQEFERKRKAAAVIECAASFSLLRYFPGGDLDVKRALMHELGRMAATAEQLQWLQQRVLAAYAEWPGIAEIRAVFCTRFTPADGRNAELATNSPIARDIEFSLIERAEEQKRLPAPAAIKQLAEAKKL